MSTTTTFFGRSAGSAGSLTLPAGSKYAMPKAASDPYSKYYGASYEAMWEQYYARTNSVSDVAVVEPKKAEAEVMEPAALHQSVADVVADEAMVTKVAVANIDIDKVDIAETEVDKTATPPSTPPKQSPSKADELKAAITKLVSPSNDNKKPATPPHSTGNGRQPVPQQQRGQNGRFRNQAGQQRNQNVRTRNQTVQHRGPAPALVPRRLPPAAGGAWGNFQAFIKKADADTRAEKDADNVNYVGARPEFKESYTKDKKSDAQEVVLEKVDAAKD